MNQLESILLIVKWENLWTIKLLPGYRKMISIRARPLTAAEERYLRNNEGEGIAFAGPLSIMGDSVHKYVNSTVHSDLVTTRREYYGNGPGDYLVEAYGYGPAEGGRTIPINWGVESAIHYVLFVARELEIPHFCSSNCVYFQCKYENAFAESIDYVDSTLHYSYTKLSWFSRLFGGVPQWDSTEAEKIREGVRQIFTKAKHT